MAALTGENTVVKQLVTGHSTKLITWTIFMHHYFIEHIAISVGVIINYH